jgi:hypothetical protein
MPIRGLSKAKTRKEPPTGVNSPVALPIGPRETLVSPKSCCFGDLFHHTVTEICTSEEYSLGYLKSCFSTGVPELRALNLRTRRDFSISKRKEPICARFVRCFPIGWFASEML